RSRSPRFGSERRQLIAHGDKLAPPGEWLALADRFYDVSLGAGGSSGIPLLWGTDAVHGHNNIPGATIFPHNIGPGATRDPALIRGIDEITALEVRVTGLDWAFSPSAAVARKAAASPRCCSAHLAGRCATTSRAGALLVAALGARAGGGRRARRAAALPLGYGLTYEDDGELPQLPEGEAGGPGRA